MGRKAADARVELMPLDEIQFALRNPKDHDLAEIEASIYRFGFVDFPTLNEATGRIVEGHGRLEALKAARGRGEPPPAHVGLRRRGKAWMVPVVRGLSWEDDTEAEAYLLAHNRTTELGGWKVPDLAAILGDLRKRTDFSFKGVGFDDAYIRELLAKTKRITRSDPDAVPDPPKTPVTKLGEVWRLGDHRLACGDCREVTPLALAGAKAQLVFTDPPWGVGYSGGTVERERMVGDTKTDLYLVACEMARDHSDAKSALYLWHAGVKGIAAAAAAAAAGWEIRCQIIWNKNLAQYGALTAQYKAKHEPAYYCYKRGKAPRWHGPTNEVTVWDCDRAAQNEHHPTQKPVELAARAMRNSSEGGHVVADFFAGSGSTLIAAEQCGRMCAAVELEPAYCDVIVERWEEFTGGKAKRQRA